MDMLLSITEGFTADVGLFTTAGSGFGAAGVEVAQTVLEILKFLDAPHANLLQSVIHLIMLYW
jgi:uncharacterized protein (UPF0254 family)